MRTHQLLTITMAFVALPVLSAAQQKSDPATILGLEKKWTEAYRQRDVTILSSLLAEDFVITVEDGSTFSKMGYITHTADSTVHVEVAEQSDFRVRMHGNVAVVTGAYHERGTSKGKLYDYRDRLTDVWMKMDGRWQVIASHYALPAKD